jgi:non-ribosomal peptide synthetase component E (peptide arylation enzyme)
MAIGYFNRPEETAAAFVGGWFKTGDMLSRRGDHLVFVKELKNTCKVNGSMVDLAEVRKAVLSFPTVQKTDVTFVDDRLSASVQLDSIGSEREKILELKQFLRGRIAEYKIPKRIVLRETHGHSSEG